MYRITRKLSVLFFLFINTTLYPNNPSWATGEIINPSAKSTKAILKRYYIISRLNEHINTLQKIYAHNIASVYQLYQESPLINFDNYTVDIMVQKIQDQSSPTPFFKLWDEYKRYQFIDDKTVSKALLRFIENLTKSFLNFHELSKENRKKFSLILNTTKELLDVHVPEITFRFYLIKRIDHIFRGLNKISSVSLEIKEFLKPEISLFTHPTIISCTNDMSKLKSVKPLLELYNEICKYHYIKDISLQREFLLLTCIVTQLKQNAQPTPNTVDCALLKKLSIVELFDVANTINETGTYTITHQEWKPQSMDTNSTIEDIIKNEIGISEDEFCNLVFRRFYFINRLSNTINTPTLKGMSQQKVRPLLLAWENFKRYQFLFDQLFIDDFSQEIFLVSASKNNRNEISNESFFKTNNQTSEKFDDFMSDIKPFVSIDSVVLRLHHIQRLKKAIKQIGHFEEYPLPFKLNNQIQFSNKAIKYCFEKIKQNKVFKPLLILSKKFESYYHIANPVFLKEYLLLLHQCYAYVFENLSEQKIIGNKKTKCVKEKRKALELMTARELIDEIDILAHQIPHPNELKIKKNWIDFFKEYLFFK